ncbi:2-C-methyl-D-erythritol 2,4-cyclodiphosphate synthase [bacterium]|nr:2-C-methyl-D-erythritol 2,4-cyclodiphosphate synthase [bacterium]|tara:strand:+ start:1362 stop:1850 length:489 start_codon:yes stop_codon:yes gene_type:complete
MALKIGIGIDSHRLETNRKLILGGITIEFHLGLVGHSDADVLTHAIMDALLGALSLGSIGDHFPDTDPIYKDADSMELLKKVVDLVYKNGFQVSNIDSVIIAEEPKLKPYINQIKENLAKTLGVDSQSVGVKATTAEKMGPEGNLEGISSHAVVLLEKMTNG